MLVGAMLNRRQFVASSCCAVPSLYACLANAQPPSPGREFICGTVDRLPGGDTPMQIERYSAGGGFDRARLQSVIREFKITPYGTAYFDHRWRRGDGLTPDTGVITLGVHFLNGSESQKSVARRAASVWLTGELGTRMAFRFDVPRNQAQITINFNTFGRNNSIVGRESAKYAQSQETMNLADLVDHIIQHEFGHAIGLQHEHQHPSVGIEWNKPAVIADMAKQGWTPDMVQRNIFERYSANYTCIGDQTFNPDLLMLYPIPRRWTVNQFSSGTNAAISDRDRRCVEGLYRA